MINKALGAPGHSKSSSYAETTGKSEFFGRQYLRTVGTRGQFPEFGGVEKGRTLICAQVMIPQINGR
jgi:hypothetical protein